MTVSEVGRIAWVPTEYYIIVNCLKMGTITFLEQAAQGIYNPLEEIKIWTHFCCG